MKHKLFSIRYLLFFLVAALGAVSIFTGCSLCDSTEDSPITIYTVSFKTNNSTALNDKKIEKGKAVTKPDAPNKSGYTFKGWYTTVSLTGEPYDFDTVVTGSFTLYAKFMELPITLKALKALIAKCKKDNTKCKKLESVNTSEITNMKYLFTDMVNFNTDISSWDTRSVTTMEGMFYGASSFDQPLNDWKTSQVTNMNFMFLFAGNFNQSLRDWDTSSVTQMNSMFHNATKFKQDISGWDVKKVTTHDNFSTDSDLTDDYSPEF